jgi:hypothetical protein
MDLLENFFENLLSDTYTLIVGFVVIGIPLALQIAVNASEKYDNALVIKRLTTGWVITPVSLIVCSTIYVIFSFSLKLLLPVISQSNHFMNDYLIKINLILALGFITIIISAAYFYIRFYYRTLKSTEKCIDDFLFLNSPLLMINWLNKVCSWKVFSKLVDLLESRKFKEKDFKSISAGLEILISQLEKKSWEKGYIDLLFKFNKKLKRAYLKQYNQPVPKLSAVDILLIKMYWDALIRIIKLSRSNQDTKLSFHSQRLLASLAVNFIHHPQYCDITTNEFMTAKEEKINWSNDLYEIARWQSQQNKQGIDLILECEWIHDVCGILAKPDYRHSRLGTVEACKIFINILELVADKHPDKIFKLYINFSEGMPSFYGYDHFSSSPWDKGTAWTNKFWAGFEQKDFCLEGDDKVAAELLSLKDGKAYVKYADYGVSRLLSKEELKSEYNRINYNEVYKKSYLNHCGFLALKFVAILAYYQRWSELKYCLEWAKPSDSQVTHTGNVLLASNDSEVEQLIFKKFETVNNYHWFFERHDILHFVGRGLLFQLIFYYEKTGKFKSFFSSGKLEDSQKHTKILNLLISQYDHLKDCDAFEQSKIITVVDALKESLKSLETRIKELLKNSDPSTVRWENFKTEIENGWHTKSQSDCLARLFMDTLNFSFTDKICPVEIQLLSKEFDKEYFIEGYPLVGSNYIFGEVAFDNVVFPIYKEMKRIAVERTDFDITIVEEALIMASADSLEKMNFTRIQNNPLWQHPTKDWKAISVSDTIFDKALFIDIQNVKLLFTKHSVCNEHQHPLFSYYENKGDDKVLVHVSAFIEVKKLSDYACLLI